MTPEKKTPVKDSGNQNENSKKPVDGANFQSPEPRPIDAPAPEKPDRIGPTDEEIAAMRQRNSGLAASVEAAMAAEVAQQGQTLQEKLEKQQQKLGEEFDKMMDDLEEELSDKVDAGEIDEDRKRELIVFAQSKDPRRTPLARVDEPPPGTARIRHISELDPSYNGKPDSIQVSSGKKVSSVRR
jgi:hypothetical protein